MRIKNLLKRLFVIGVAFLFAVTPMGCYDLGDYEGGEDGYYASFGDIRLVYQNPNNILKDIKVKDYDFRDYFYNKNTFEDFKYGDPQDDEDDEGKDIPYLSYLYLAIPVKDDLCVDTLVIYFNTQTTDSLKVKIYLVDSLPSGGYFTMVKGVGDPELQQLKDELGNPIVDEFGQPVMETIVYTDPSEEYLVGQTTAKLEKNTWDSIMIEYWGDEETVQVKKDQYLLLQFVNNGGYRSELDNYVSFKMTNLLIRAIFED